MFIAIVPAYNEEKTIGSVARDLFGHVDKVVVVDDGSEDKTSEVARSAGAAVLRHKINRGQGAALQTGDECALKLGADYVLHFDADGQFNTADIKPALEKLKNEKADVLFGSRFFDSRSNVPFFKRRFLLPAARLINFLFTGVSLSDVHNGFRILNRNALEKIAITHDRMAHASEILSQIKKCGLKCIEFPVKVLYKEYGQGMRGGVEVVKDLLLGRFIK